jgi:hypothetical protein
MIAIIKKHGKHKRKLGKKGWIQIKVVFLSKFVSIFHILLKQIQYKSMLTLGHKIRVWNFGTSKTFQSLFNLYNCFFSFKKNFQNPLSRHNLFFTFIFKIYIQAFLSGLTLTWVHFDATIIQCIIEKTFMTIITWNISYNLIILVLFINCMELSLASNWSP